MPRISELLERESMTVELEGDHFERLLRRRDRKQRDRRLGAAIVVTLIVVVVVRFLTLGMATEVPVVNPPQLLPHDGMVIRFTGDPYSSGDLVAQDPATGEVRTIIQAYSRPLQGQVIYNAAPSGDGSWVAFDAHTDCRGGGGPGLWVTNGSDEPRRLTKPCDEGSDPDALGLWEWSPSGAQLLVALGTAGGGALVLIDPATGDRTNLGATAGIVTSIAWSPDGSRIAYSTVPVGTPDAAANRVQASLYSVDARGGDVALLASLMGQVPGGEEGSGIRWSPDGRRIAVLGGIGDARLYLVRADGSGAELVTGGVHVEHILGGANVDWSPDGTRIAYATFAGDRQTMQIWNASPGGSNPIRVFGSASAPGKRLGSSGDPVWSPDGTQIAFRFDTSDEGKVWLVANADGTGNVHQIDDLQPLDWRGGWYFCECYG